MVLFVVGIEIIVMSRLMKKSILVFSLILSLFAAGCGSQDNQVSVSERATQDFIRAVETSIVETIDASIQETLDVSTPTNQVDQPTATNAVSLQPTNAPTQPQSAFTPTPTDLPTPCYLAELVEENIPDGTVMNGGDGFTKQWVVMNAGVCAWGEKFRWVLVSGDDFGGPTNVKISNEDVMPGETVSVSIEMGAPIIPGHYHSVYKIFTDEGVEITPNGFWIDFVVADN
jgi:hypothetical protein